MTRAPAAEVRPELPGRLGWALGSGTILQGFNSSIIAVAMVSIGVFYGNESALPWLVSGMYIACAVASPTAGRLVDLFGARRLYLAGLGIVLAGSVLGPFAPGIGELIAVRVLMGIGASIHFPAAMAIIRRSAEDRDASNRRAIGTIALCGQTMAAVGPSIGGFLVVAGGWQAIFWANIPLVAASALMVFRTVDPDPRPVPRSARTVLKLLDVPGLLLFVLALVALMAGLLELDGALFTAAALLARTYASLRSDAAAAVDLAEAGTLALRLAAPAAPSLDAAAARLGRTIPGSLMGVRDYIASPGPENLLVTGRRPASGTQTADDDVTHLSRVLSRYCPVTLFDCPPGLGPEAVRWALAESHLALFVTPASVAGLDDAAHAAQLWRADPALAQVPLLVLLTRTAARSPLRPAAEARRLRRAGVETAVLDYDAHLAAGVEIQPRLLSRAARLQAAELSARVLSAASAAPGMPARRAASRQAESGTGRRARV